MVKNRVLFVCTVPALSSYSIGVISTAFLSAKMECYACIFTDDTGKQSKSDLMRQFKLPLSKIDQVTFKSINKNGIIKTVLAGRYFEAIAKFARKNNIKKIHFISQDVMLAGCLHKFREFKLFYTVHDLVAHEMNLGFMRTLKHYYYKTRRDKLIVNVVDNLITNSVHQKLQLDRIYPNKNVHFHEMPSLITPSIQKGTVKLKEIGQWTNYVLFFGRIEPYKGLKSLYESFINDADLKDVKLVIAGKGSLYFQRVKAKEHNVLIINRYIKDEELNHLFDNALMLVMPYISSTQSAVSSLAYHYSLPVIASNIEGLKDTITDQYTGLLCKNQDGDQFKDLILKLISDDQMLVQIKENIKFQNHFYNQETLLGQLDKIYE